jgi:hypothetical protein
MLAFSGSLATLLFLSSIFLEEPAWARNYNYQDVPLGERAFGMGSVSVALDGDVGNMFFNPATLARETSGQVSAALSAYTRVDGRSGTYVSLFQSMVDNVSQGGFVPIPSMVGGNMKAGPWTWGGSILVPYSYKTSGIEKNGANITSFEGFQEDVWLGAFASRNYGKWDIGVSAFYASRTYDEKFFFVTEKESSTDLDVRFFQTNFSANGMLFVFGAVYEVEPGLRAGFSIRSPVWTLGGSAGLTDSKKGSEVEDRFETPAYKTYPLPLRLSGGVSYHLNAKVLLAADIHIYSPLKIDFSVASSANELRFDAGAIANTAFGVEYLPWPKMGFRAGWFTNLSSAREAPKQLTVIQDKVHMFGGTMAVFFPKPTGSMSLGGYIQGGQGSIANFHNPQLLIPRSNYFYGFVVASNYRF